MKIAMVHSPLWRRGGAERQLLKLAIELQKYGHEVEIFTNALSQECYPDLLKKLTINVISHPLKWLHVDSRLQSTSATNQTSPEEVRETSLLRKSMEKMLWRQLYTRELLFATNLGRKIPKGFDIINNHNFPSEWAAFFAKKRLKAPIVWMCNEPHSWFFSTEPKKRFSKLYWPLFEIFDKIVVSYIDEIVVLSRIAAGYVRNAYNRSTRIVRSGVDTQLFHNASGESIRKTYDLEDSFVLLQVGNFGNVRRNTDSIKALYYLSKNFDNVKLILDGYGLPEQIDALVTFSERLGVRQKVFLFHTTSDEELAEVYAACDVFVFPAQITWGLAVIEAMAAAKPVVVSRRCGASEIIQNGVNGLVIDHAKPKEMAKQVESLMNNAKLRKKIGENAYEYVKNHLSWEKYAKNMERIFEQTVSSRHD
jgi:glycosyltransferase involved in cell wall biosynthesis